MPYWHHSCQQDRRSKRHVMAGLNSWYHCIRRSSNGFGTVSPAVSHVCDLEPMFSCRQATMSTNSLENLSSSTRETILVLSMSIMQPHHCMELVFRVAWRHCDFSPLFSPFFFIVISFLFSNSGRKEKPLARFKLPTTSQMKKTPPSMFSRLYLASTLPAT